MTYEFNGEQYREASSRQRLWGARLIEEIELTGDEHILDMYSHVGNTPVGPVRFH